MKALRKTPRKTPTEKATQHAPFSLFRCFVALLTLAITSASAVAVGESDVIEGTEQSSDAHPPPSPVSSVNLVTEIDFIAPRPLNRDDLLTLLPIRIGTPWEDSLKADCERALLSREIFASVRTKVDRAADGVHLAFELTPIITVGEVEFVGGDSLDDRALRRMAGLRLGEPYRVEDGVAARERLLEGYRREGFPDTRISIEMLPRLEAAQFLVRFRIEERFRLKILGIVLRGTVPPEVESLPKDLEQRVRGAFATQENLKRMRRELLSAIRREGYLQASLDVHYEPTPEANSGVLLVVEVEPRHPLSILFRGNTRFDVEQLLEPLKLDTRTVPFTPAAIVTLCREIERMYEEAGYFFAHVSSRELGEENGRTYFEITISEGRRVRPRDVHFEGNSSFPEEVLREKIQGETPITFHLWGRDDRLTKELIVSQLNAIEQWYDQEGFIGTRASFELIPVEEGSEVDVLYRIQEAPRRELDEVTVEWVGVSDQLLEQEVLSPLLSFTPTVRVGDLLREEALEKNRMTLQSLLFEKGFPRAEVDVQLAARSAKFLVTPGPLIHIGEIRIAGVSTTDDSVIRRELRVESGAPYRSDKIRESERSLARLAIFRSVSIAPTDGKLDGPVEDLTVHVVERDTGMFQVGTTASSEDGLHLFGEISQRNVGGENRTVQLNVNGYIKTAENLLDAGHARALYLEPHIFDSDLSLSVEGFALYSLRLVDAFRVDRTGISTALRGSINEHLGGHVDLGVTDVQTREVPDDIVIGEDDVGTTFISFVRGDLDWDRRDDQANPRQGFRISSHGRVASSVLGSDVDFAELSSHASVLFPLSTRLVWSNGLRGTILEPFGDTEVIPLAERLFLGGRNTLRGFSRNAIGPRGFDGDIVGGDRTVVFNTELQYDLTESLVGITFLDIGQAFLNHSGTFAGDTHSFSDLRFSPGIGLRYRTPIGPLSTEVGFATDREFGERWGRILFAIGNQF